MVQPITEDTLVTVRLDGEFINTTTLGLFLADNFVTDEEQREIRANLARGEAYRGGGGAAPEWSVERDL